MLVIAGMSLVAAALISARVLPVPQEENAGPLVEAPADVAVENPLPTNLPPAASQPTAVPVLALPTAQTAGKRVGIVAGHAGYDPGAVCDDGLTEAEVNLTVAQAVVLQLQARGYQVDLLEEFDDRLAGYQADALVSIHADSCDVPGASGFKVARVTDSAIPEAEDQLVQCLYSAYEAATSLAPHPNSITDNMTNYHAFGEIDSFTPGAIIETGFLLEDRNLLVKHPDLVATGIADGVTCFLEPSP